MTAPPDLSPPPPTRPHRPTSRWILLLLVWTIGLIVWIGWIVALGAAIFRIF